MTEVWTDIAGAAGSPALLIADHASNRLPAGCDLGLPAAAMQAHIAWDIGVDPLARAIAAQLGCPAVLGGASRLLIDLNREEDAPGLIPAVSDGWTIPGNVNLDDDARVERVATYWRPYHDHIAELIRVRAPKLLISLHSFTARLATSDAPRPWQIGILYNRDARAARIALPALERAGVIVGDNLPYSGQVLNATMNRHGEHNGIPYLGIEVRQDLIGDEAGVAHWSDRLLPVISTVLSTMAPR